MASTKLGGWRLQGTSEQRLARWCNIFQFPYYWYCIDISYMYMYLKKSADLKYPGRVFAKKHFWSHIIMWVQTKFNYQFQTDCYCNSLMTMTNREQMCGKSNPFQQSICLKTFPIPNAYNLRIGAFFEQGILIIFLMVPRHWLCNRAVG